MSFLLANVFILEKKNEKKDQILKQKSFLLAKKIAKKHNPQCYCSYF